MTVRELIQALISETSNLDAEVYVSEVVGDDLVDFDIARISNDGMDYGLNIDLKKT